MFIAKHYIGKWLLIISLPLFGATEEAAQQENVTTTSEATTLTSKTEEQTSESTLKVVELSTTMAAPILNSFETTVAPDPTTTTTEPSKTLKPVLVRNVPLSKPEENTYDSGYPSNNNEMPYVAALFFSTQSHKWFCAGTILSKGWILTTASCTTYADYVKISLGATKRSKPKLVMYVTSRAFHMHDHYDKKKYRNDIALIQVPALSFSRSIKPVTLPKTSLYDEDVAELWTFSAGWGLHNETEESTEELHITQIQVLPNEVCFKTRYGKAISEGMLCGLPPNKGATCRLDSGSPMVLQDDTLLVGIASFANQHGCMSRTPIIYTKILSYISWISSTAGISVS
ncbi:serine protease 1-like [Scaptodrosophila lebanonensis]|uniref:trypsin n=1 Tax=Drosophila lebanonensis TaxID=7225 RepID=A0A6J2TA03_DROLE|nr:serine protease 1-like [Scaptodrosophila lebanonensis]